MAVGDVTVWVLGFSLLGPLGTLVGSGVLWRFPVLREKGRTPLVAFSVGSLLAAVFMALIPEAIAQNGVKMSLNLVLAGFAGFFFLEKLVRLPHRHAEKSRRPMGTLMMVGDAVHNFVDGMVLATAFLVSVPLGILTSLAVFAHELPQEFGEFVVLLESGMAPGRAYGLNGLVALTIVPGAWIMLIFESWLTPMLGGLLAVAAAGFLYVAATDLAPILHEETGILAGLGQAIGLLAGVGIMWALQAGLG